MHVMHNNILSGLPLVLIPWCLIRASNDANHDCIFVNLA